MTSQNKPDNLPEEELVPESHGPFGDYYVPISKRNRSRELREALEALKDAN